MLLRLYSALARIQHAVSPQGQEVTGWEKRMLGMMGAKSYRLADQARDSEILGQVKELYRREGMTDTPKVIFYEQEIPNAAFLHTGAILISTGLLKTLEKDERETIIAHEIAHQQQTVKDMAVLGGYLISAPLAALGAMALFRKHGHENRKNNILALGVVGGLAYKATQYLLAIPAFAYKRSQELVADKAAAWMTRKPEFLANALQKLERHRKEHRFPMHSTDSVSNNLVPASPVQKFHTAAGMGEGLERLYSTHPQTKERVKRLHQIKEEQLAKGMHHSQQRTVEGPHSARLATPSEESRASSFPPIV